MMETLTMFDEDRFITKLVTALAERMNTPEQLLTIEQLSAQIGVSISTIHSWTSKNKDFPCLRGRPLKFRQSQVESWMRRRY